MDEHSDAAEATPEGEPAAKSRRMVMVIFALIALLILAPVILIVPYVHHQLTARSPTPVAIYEGYSIRQDPEFRELVMNFESETPPGPVYVQLPDERKFLLVELPEDEVAKLLPKIPERDPPTGANEYSDARSFLTYRDGKLAFAVLHAQSKKFRIAGRVNGPFTALPCTREQLIVSFGEPLRWERPAQAAEEEDQD
jgi:flagellar basal body-associated protein FliL